ncbi:tetratricopeptide repeat protein [Bauldia sp.]|uniref:tetratricopeptide repeat protein n=1 Tax=Bauldia sp. TaxID=2575872 RepID=UPI003BAA334F
MRTGKAVLAVMVALSGVASFASTPASAGEIAPLVRTGGPQCGDSDFAGENVGAAVDALVDNARKELSLARSGVEDEHFQNAVSNLECAIRLDPDNSSLRFELGQAYRQAEQFTTALVQYDRAIEIDDQVVDYWVARGLMLAGLERRDEAMSSFDRAVEIDPSDASGYAARGMQLTIDGAFGDALIELNKANYFRPNTPLILYFRATSRFATFDFEGAISDYTEVIEMGPAADVQYYKSSLSGRGNILWGLDRHELALKDYRRYLEFVPDDKRVKARVEELERKLGD